MGQMQLGYETRMIPQRGIDRIPHVVILPPAEARDLMSITDYNRIRKYGVNRALNPEQAVWLFLDRQRYSLTRKVFHALQERGEGFDRYAFPLPEFSYGSGDGRTATAGDSNYASDMCLVLATELASREKNCVRPEDRLIMARKILTWRSTRNPERFFCRQ